MSQTLPAVTAEGDGCMGGDQGLLDQVFDRLAEDEVADEVADLVLAAYAGDEQLAAVLSGGPADLPERDPATRPRPSPLYLESVTVAGFRGVGPQQSLRLQPHAGITLIIGRNGSGKLGLTAGELRTSRDTVASLISDLADAGQQR